MLIVVCSFHLTQKNSTYILLLTKQATKAASLNNIQNGIYCSFIKLVHYIFIELSQNNVYIQIYKYIKLTWLNSKHHRIKLKKIFTLYFYMFIIISNTEKYTVESTSNPYTSSTPEMTN
jgi:hypothetical protein